RAVEPRAHRPEDVLARRPPPEGPRLREIRRADWTVQLVRQGRRRWSVGPAERAVALAAAVVHVEFLPRLDRRVRHARCARELHRLRDAFLAREIGGEGRDEVGEVLPFLIGGVWRGG